MSSKKDGIALSSTGRYGVITKYLLQSRAALDTYYYCYKYYL
jgi:hypothetical protein